MKTQGELVYDIEGRDSVARWVRVNDGVMGGLSQSTLTLFEIDWIKAYKDAT